MKKPNLSLAPMRARSHDKYAGEPGSPNFVPSTPLIERQVLSARLEGELKRACAVVLADIKSCDEDLGDVPAYLKDQIQSNSNGKKFDKHSSFTFSPPQLFSPEAVSSAIYKNPQRKQEAVDQDFIFEPLEPAHTRVSRRTKPSFTDPEEEALYEIRKKIDVRPKTSAAACIDYTGGETSSSSNRTSRTTPYTSAGITPRSTSKRFSEAAAEIAAFEGVETFPLPANEDVPETSPEANAKARAWLAKEFARRQQQDFSKTAYPMPYQPSNFNHTSSQALQRPVTRAGSIKNSIREYIRPGSSSGTRAPSIHSVAVSTRSSAAQHMQDGFSRLKKKISNSSLASRVRQGSTSSRTGFDDGDEYFIDAQHILNRPLPPLPGLDSYVERRPHISDLLRPTFRSKRTTDDDVPKIIDEKGMARVLSNEEATKREQEMRAAVLDKMTGGSIGSGANGVISPALRPSMQANRSSCGAGSEGASGGLSRPVTRGSRTGALGIIEDVDHRLPGLRPNVSRTNEKSPSSGGVVRVQQVDLLNEKYGYAGEKQKIKSPKSPFKKWFGFGSKSKFAPAA